MRTQEARALEAVCPNGDCHYGGSKRNCYSRVYFVSLYPLNIVNAKLCLLVSIIKEQVLIPRQLSRLSIIVLSYSNRRDTRFAPEPPQQLLRLKGPWSQCFIAIYDK